MKASCLVLSMFIAGCASSSSTVERSADRPAKADTAIGRAWDEAFLTRDLETYRRVTSEFETHLASDPSDREARNRYGKLLYAQGRWREAATVFEAVAAGSDHFAQAAARNALLAWRRVLDHGDASDEWFRPLAEDEDVDKAVLSFLWDEMYFETLENGSYAESPMSEPEQRIADAADRYVSIADPLEESLTTIQLISAHSHFRHHRFADAADRCLRIVQRWPRSSTANTCGNVTLNMFSATDQNEELERYARQLWQNTAAMKRHTELASTIEETLHYVAFQNAWKLVEDAQKKKGDDRKRLLLVAAERFQRYQDEFPQSPHADKALYNALAQYVSLGVKDNARTVAMLIVEDYPKSPVAREARQVLAKLGR